MIRTLLTIAILTILTLPGVSLQAAQELRGTPAPKIIHGQVRQIEGGSYLIRDRAGNETRLVTDPNTDLEGTISMGAEVAAEVETNGRVKSIKRIPMGSGVTKIPERR